MDNMERKIANLIEKIINIRIDDILEKSNLSIEINNKIKEENKNIVNEKKVKKVKKTIPKDDKIMNPYTLYVKDATNMMKDISHLNYLQDYIKKIKDCKNKRRNEQFKEFSIIWNNLDNEVKNKYINLCQNKDFSNSKYNEMVKKTSTPKIPRKKKSKESLKI
jgi:hypothetical protein